MFVKIVTETIIDCSDEGFKALQSLDKEAIITKLDVSGCGKVTITEISDVDHEANTEGTNQVDDEWDDEFCEVEDPQTEDAPEDDNV